jgi:hypothetical protein
MNRGILLFAFNSPEYNYFKMAEFTAKRVNHFLNLPVSIVTDKNSYATSTGYAFDNVYTIDSDPNNTFQGRVWLNKGRYRSYELSPYDETILLDVDYVVNSDTLLKVFDVMDDFCCHESINFLMNEYNKKEHLDFANELSIPTLWATVVGFKKTKRVENIFQCLKMVQENYPHYGNIHNFSCDTYRNDYGLTIAHRIVNGHADVKADIIPWNLTHIGPKTYVYKNNNDEFCADYTIVYDKWMRGKIKKEYITIKNMDFHVINKDIFMELCE